MSAITTVTTTKVLLPSGANVFYREAGAHNKKTILLLHGFPTSSNMFRNLIPILGNEFHVVAPDLPGFGFTEVRADHEFTFASAADVIDEFVKKLKLIEFAIYIFDYGSPVGLRLALKDPTRITGIISQNGNAYVEGLDKSFWGPLIEYWATKDRNNKTYTKALGKFLKDNQNIIDQYKKGFKDEAIVDPTPIALDEYFSFKPNYVETQLDYFFDYGSNVVLYPSFQNYFRVSGVPALIIWGKNDYIFTVDGAEAYKRDIKDITSIYVESGHFALESHLAEFSDAIIKFLRRV